MGDFRENNLILAHILSGIGRYDPLNRVRYCCRGRHPVVVWDRCVALQWPLLRTFRHTLTGGRRLSSQIWSSHPGRRFHDLSGSRVHLCLVKLSEDKQLNKFVQKMVWRNGLLVLWTISYENRQKWFSWIKCRSDAHSYLEYFWADAVNRTMLGAKLSGSFCTVIYCVQRSKNMRALCRFCRSVSSVIAVLWHELNRTNDHITFQDKANVIIWEDNLRLNDFTQHSAFDSF